MAVKKSIKKNNIKKGSCPCGCDKKSCNCKNGVCVCGSSKDNSVKYTNMFAAYCAFWRRGFTEWRGTSSRSEYWWSWLMNVLVCLALVLVMLLTAYIDKAPFGEIGGLTFSVGSILWAYLIAALIPAISMLTRRMHDAGLPAWFWLLYLTTFIPVAGSYIWSVIILIIALLPTKVADNPYHKFNR